MAIRLLQTAIAQLRRLERALGEKEMEFYPIIKMGRTQMQDAVPIRLGQEFKAYADAVERSILRIAKAADELRVINLGGTAIGTGVNADDEYIGKIVPGPDFTMHTMQLYFGASEGKYPQKLTMYFVTPL